MTEKYWDPLNKAAVLVTLFTGIPAFLTFVGLPYVAAVVLGLLSISSLSFVLVRGRALEARGNRLAELNINDQKLIKSFNELIAGNDIDRLPTDYIKGLLVEALDNIRNYVEADTACQAVVSLRELKPNMDVVRVAASGNEDTKSRTINISEATDLSNAWYEAGSQIIYPEELGGRYKNIVPEFTYKYKTSAIYPIMAAHKSSEAPEPQKTWWGFFIVDLEKRKTLSEETKGILLKYSHLFFLLFSGLSTSIELNAQQVYPADAPKARAADT